MRTFEYLDRLPPKRLSRRHRLVLYYVLSLVSIIGLYTVLYYAGMRYAEGRPRSLFHALNIVVETMTTTGYGSDSPWETPLMNV